MNASLSRAYHSSFLKDELEVCSPIVLRCQQGRRRARRRCPGGRARGPPSSSAALGSSDRRSPTCWNHRLSLSPTARYPKKIGSLRQCYSLSGRCCAMPPNCQHSLRLAWKFHSSQARACTSVASLSESDAKFLSQALPYIAFDLQPQRVKAARAAGFNVLYGDASRPQVLVLVNF